MIIVADEVRGGAINSAEKEHDIIRIHGVMAEMKEDHGDQLSVPGYRENESLHFYGRNTVVQQLFRILSQCVETVQKGELPAVPSVHYFAVGTRGVTAEPGCKHHVCIQHCSQPTRHLELRGDGLMLLFEDFK